MFTYGDKVRYTPTGYEGVVTAHVTYFGKKPDQYMVEALDTTGRPIEYWADEGQLHYIGE
ncbi:MAG: hypothetical protein II008_19085 [Oscillospiraceae bacterium]|nr:hypothetical protein [Oscillospiraceae bacterium]